MSVRKIKEFFGLSPEAVDDYYDDELDYDSPRYDSDYRSRYDSDVYSAGAHRESTPRYDRSYGCATTRVEITRYADATSIGEPFRDGDAVVFDISALSADDARRIVDFAAGLGFALRGRMEKLAPRVFSLVPDGATVTRSELERLVRA